MTEIKTKKILCIMQLPPPMHGASLSNNNLINSEVLKKNYSIDLINLQFAKSIEEIGNFTILKVFKTFYYGFIITKKIILQRPDLVYYTLAPMGFALYRDATYVFLMKFLKRRIVFHLHGKGIKKNIGNNLLKKYLFKFVFKQTYVICLSKNLTNDISEVYYSTPFIVPYGIQIAPIVYSKSIHRLNGTVPEILYLSNYIRTKGILVLIEALSLLKSQGYDFVAKFVGAPADLSIEMLEKIVSDNKLTEFIKVNGPLYGDDKVVEFKNADIFAFPTFYRNEAFPLAILEAMQFSLPVVSTFEGGIPEMIIDGETGFLVETQNAQMLAEKLGVLLKNEHLRLEMGKKGYERFVNNFTLNHFENNINATFQNILKP